VKRIPADSGIATYPTGNGRRFARRCTTAAAVVVTAFGACGMLAKSADANPTRFVLFDFVSVHTGDCQDYADWNFDDRRRFNKNVPLNWLAGEKPILDHGVYVWRVEVRRMERPWKSAMHVQFGWSNFVREIDPSIKHVAGPPLVLTELLPPAPGKPWVYEYVGTIRALDVTHIFYGAGPKAALPWRVTDWDWTHAYAQNTAYTLLNPRGNPLDENGDGWISAEEYPDLEFRSMFTVYMPGDPEYEAVSGRLSPFKAWREPPGKKTGHGDWEYPTDGLVGHWSFDERSGPTAADSSPNALHGEIRGAIPVEGKRRRALQFDGQASVEIANDPALEITGDITIAAWVFKDAPNSALRWDAIVSKSPGKWDYELLTSKAKSDELAFYSKTGKPDEVYSGRPVITGRWQHVAVTRRGSEVCLYLDGQPASKVTMSGDFPRTGGGLQIGNDGARTPNGMIGRIDEVFLYRRALSAEEVRQLM
jgi:hypothetical protein